MLVTMLIVAIVAICPAPARAQMKNHVFPIRGVPGVTQRQVDNQPYNSPSGW